MGDKSKLFDEINLLYSKYVEIDALNKIDSESYSAAFRSAWEKLCVAVYKVYASFERENDNYEVFSDVIVYSLGSGIEKFPDSKSKEAGVPFSKYVCNIIRNNINKEISNQAIAQNNGGCSFSDYDREMVRKVLSAEKKVLKLPGCKDNQDKCNEKIAVLLNISVETVIKYKNLSLCNTCSDVISSEDDEFYVSDNKTFSDFFIDLRDSDSLEENRIKLSESLKKIENTFALKPDLFLSKIITIELLNGFKKLRDEYIKEYDPTGEQLSNSFYHNVYDELKKFSFVDKDILNSFFCNPDFKLPKKKEITDNFHVDKSWGSAVVSDFRARIFSEKK